MEKPEPATIHSLFAGAFKNTNQVVSDDQGTTTKDSAQSSDFFSGKKNQFSKFYSSCQQFLSKQCERFIDWSNL